MANSSGKPAPPPPPPPAPTTSALVLYDTTGAWGWLGEIYAIMTANLASHFGSWTAMPVISYKSGLINQYTATIYIGSTYDEPLPVAFLDDVLGSTKPVIWIYDNIWQLTARDPNFQSNYGWTWTGFDSSEVAAVQYKGQMLKRHSANAAGPMGTTVGAAVMVLANCVRSSDGSTFPWALRSSRLGGTGSLTYISENPFAYISEGDRYLAFCDLLFDTLAPSTPVRHRAIVRLEDIDPTFDPVQLRAVADYLFAEQVPFGFQIIPVYTDPVGYYNNGVPETIPLSKAPDVISALKYMQSSGGVMMLHGYTHQYSNLPNPYSSVTGDDCEFFRITKNADGSLNYLGPVSEDSNSNWAKNRFTSASNELSKAGLTTKQVPLPQFLTFPSYAASASDYRAAQSVFGQYYGTNFVRAERALYFSGLLTGGTIDPTRFTGQFMPYTVRDVYGTKVLADTLGGIDPIRTPQAILDDAQRTLVVRDGVASFFWHPYDDIQLLKDTITGLKGLGYTFVRLTDL